MTRFGRLGYFSATVRMSCRESRRADPHHLAMVKTFRAKNQADSPRFRPRIREDARTAKTITEGQEQIRIALQIKSDIAKFSKPSPQLSRSDAWAARPKGSDPG